MLLEIGVQLIVLCSSIEIKIVIGYLFYLLLINLLLLASFDERFFYGELDCFLEVENNKFKNFKDKDLADKATEEFWK